MTEDHVDAGIAQQVRDLEAALEIRGIVSGAELDSILDRVQAISTRTRGAQVVARAWVDPKFKERLLADANAAIGEVGFSMAHGSDEPMLRVVENTRELHNVVVCTLCSCYPIALLGPSPSWYKSEAYRSRVVREPRAVLRELGFALEADVAVRVWDSTAETRYLVMPIRPAGSEAMAEEALAGIVTRRGVIGTAAV